MALIFWTNQAIEDLENIGEYIEKDSHKYASITLRRIYNSALLLKDHPKLGRIVPEFEFDSIREVIEGRYRIVYRIIDLDRIDIITIHHSSRLLRDV